MDKFFRLTDFQIKRTILSLVTLTLLSGCGGVDRTDAGENKVASPDSVVKAKVDIPKGLQFTNEMLELGKIGDAAQAKTVFHTKDKVVGKKAAGDISSGTVITSDHFEKYDSDKEAESSESKEETETKSAVDGTKTDTAQEQTQE